MVSAHFCYALGWAGTKAVVPPPVCPLRAHCHLRHFRIGGCVPNRYGRTLLHLAARFISIIMFKAFVLCCRAIVCAAVIVWRW